VRQAGEVEVVIPTKLKLSAAERDTLEGRVHRGRMGTDTALVNIEREFKDPATGEGCEYARRAWRRMLADEQYLTTFSSYGHEAAAVRVCEDYGHDVRGGLCLRCGMPAEMVRLERR
jgi:hypothetical protein